MNKKNKKLILITIILLFLPISIAFAAPQQQQFTTSFVTFLVKVALIIGAAFVPMTLGDKLAQSISRTVGNLTKNTRKNAWKKSGIGATLAARQKFKEGEALTKAQERMGRGGFLSKKLGYHKLSEKYGDTKMGQAFGLMSSDQRLAAESMVRRQYKDRAELATKDERNAYLKRYAIEHEDGSLHFDHNKREAFDKNYLAQSMLSAQSDAGLLNDDITNKLTYLNEMRQHKLALEDGDIIASNGKNGGYDLVSDETFSRDASSALGKLGSAMGKFKTPEMAAGVGSEWADRFMQQYHGINVNKTYSWTDKDGIAHTANGYALKHGLNHASARVTANGSVVTEDRQKGFNSVDQIVKASFQPGDIEKLFQSEESGRKAMKIFGNTGTKGYEGSSGVPGGSRIAIEDAHGNHIADDGFVGLLGRVHPEAARQARASMDYHRSTGRVALPTSEKGGEPHELVNPKTGRPFGQ